MTDRKSPSGPISSVKGTIAIAATPVPTTTLTTVAGSFVATSGPSVLTDNNGVVSLSPRANLGATMMIAWARVTATNVVTIGFVNVGASAAQAAVTFDADIQIE